MVDVVRYLGPKIDAFRWPTPFLYVTMHRKEFTDRPERMRGVFDAIAVAASKEGVEIVYPVHPRTRDCYQRAGFEWPFAVCAPLGVAESLARIQRARVVVTDSGGIQEEAAILQTPCVTVRENTERDETVLARVNVVTGFDTDRIRAAIREACWSTAPLTQLYGGTGVGDRVVDALM